MEIVRSLSLYRFVLHIYQLTFSLFISHSLFISTLYLYLFLSAVSEWTRFILRISIESDQQETYRAQNQLWKRIFWTVSSVRVLVCSLRDVCASLSLSFSVYIVVQNRRIQTISLEQATIIQQWLLFWTIKPGDCVIWCMCMFLYVLNMVFELPKAVFVKYNCINLTLTHTENEIILYLTFSMWIWPLNRLIHFQNIWSQAFGEQNVLLFLFEYWAPVGAYGYISMYRRVCGNILFVFSSMWKRLNLCQWVSVIVKCVRVWQGIARFFVLFVCMYVCECVSLCVWEFSSSYIVHSIYVLLRRKKITFNSNTQHFRMIEKSSGMWSSINCIHNVHM